MRAIAIVLIAGMAILLGGCAELIDSEQRRICRSLLPALDRVATRFEIDRIEDSRMPDGTIVRVIYRAAAVPPGRPAGKEDFGAPRTLACSFAASTSNALPVLTDVTIGGATLGPVRLHMLQRFWIDNGLAAQSDPMPVLVLDRAPAVSRTVAIAMQQALGSLPVIAIYALLATAYSLIYGLIGRINLAFGDLSSLAGYGAFLGFSMIGDTALRTAVLVAMIMGLVTAAMHGGALGKLVIGRLAQARGQHILIATIGVSIFWQEAMRLTQGAGNRWISPLLNRPVGIARADGFTVTVTPMALVVAVVALTAALAVVIAMRRFRFGLRWRATADDAVAAAMFGIDPRATLVRTMVLAALLSGLGGVLTTLYYGGVGYSGGLVIGLKALVAAIIGGIGSINGALIGAILVGVTETLWSSFFAIEYRDPALFVALVFVLWLKPLGLYGVEPPSFDRRG
jgi:branched-chain amino acid transport system permease protein